MKCRAENGLHSATLWNAFIRPTNFESGPANLSIGRPYAFSMLLQWTRTEIVSVVKLNCDDVPKNRNKMLSSYTDDDTDVACNI